MVEYAAIFSSESPAMHERLKHLHHISCLSQSLLVTHWQSESKFPRNYEGGPLTRWLVEQPRGLAQCWTHADGAVQCCSGHVAKECQLTELEAECLLWKASGVRGTFPPELYKGVWSRLGLTWVISFLQPGCCSFLCLSHSLKCKTTAEAKQDAKTQPNRILFKLIC